MAINLSNQDLQAEIKSLKEALNRAEQNEKKYKHLFDNSPITVYVTDRQGVVLNINEAGVQQLGFDSKEEIIGMKAFDVLCGPVEDKRLLMESLEKYGFVKGLETQVRCKSGEIMDVEITTSIRSGMVGKMEGYEGFMLNISSRKQIEQKLRYSEKKYFSVLNNSLSAIFMFQNGGIFTYVNPTLVNMLGYDFDNEIIGYPFWQFVHPDDRQMVKERGLKREKTEVYPQHYPFRAIKKDGSVIWIDMQATHATFLGEKAVVGNFIDITDEKRAEEEVRYLSRKLIEAIEEERKVLAADLHDEFGRGLTALQFDLEKLKRDYPSQPDQAIKQCDSLMNQVQTLAESIRTTTSRLRPDLLDHLGLVPTLEWYIKDYRERLPDITIEFQSTGLKKRLNSDTEVVLYRVFQEGLNNIIKHAVASNVKIMLTYSHPNVIFTLKDDGVGFNLEEHFNPAESKMGIGLLSMKERVASLDGTIAINSKPGLGTIIRVELPVQKHKGEG